MNKCKVCGSDMIELFSSSACPNDCDKICVDNSDKGDTTLDPPKEKEAKNIHRRSGFFSTPTEEEVQKQKKAALKALANFNTMAWKLVGNMTHMIKAINEVVISLEEFGKTIEDLCIPNEQLADYDNWFTGVHSGRFDVYKHPTESLYKIVSRYDQVNVVREKPTIENYDWDLIEEKHGINNPKDKKYAADWYRQEYQRDFTCDIEPVPMPSIMDEAINAEAHRLMHEQERKIIEILGIPRRLLGKGIYNEVD